jgi:hypothetical protein
MARRYDDNNYEPIEDTENFSQEAQSPYKMADVEDEDGVNGEVSDAEDLQDQRAFNPYDFDPSPTPQPQAVPLPAPPAPQPSIEARQQAALSKVAPPPPQEPSLPSVSDEDETDEDAPKIPNNADRIAQLMAQYKALQESAARKNNIAAMFDGGAQIGQALAGRYSGNFKTDPHAFDSLRQSGEQAVKNFEEAQKVQKSGQGLLDETALRDPKSKVSEFYRAMAKQRNIPVTDDMSAWDIQNMAKVIGKPSAAGQEKFRSSTVINKKDGTVIQGFIGQLSHKIVDSEGNPLGPEWIERSKTGAKTYIDPLTKERVGFESSIGRPTGYLTGPMAHPGALPPIPAPGSKEAQEFHIDRNTLLTSQQAQQLDHTRDKFSSEIKDDRNALNAAKRVLDNLDVGQAIGADDAMELKDQLSRAYGQKGHITDASLSRALSKPDFMSHMTSALSLAANGTIDDENRKWLKDVASAIKRQNETFINDKAQVYVNRLHTDWKDSPNLKKYNIGPQHIAELLGVKDAAMQPDMVTIYGKNKYQNGKQVPKEKADAIVKASNGLFSFTPQVKGTETAQPQEDEQ